MRIRERLKKNRTQLINEVRGLLQEYGITIPLGARKVYKEDKLTAIMKRALSQLACELLNLDEEMKFYERELSNCYESHVMAKKISAIPGIGVLTALSIVSLVDDGKQFENARHFSAYLGLVPRQSSSGGREKLLGISKRGNTLVRTLLIHGARAVISHVDKKTDKRSQWIKNLKERRGHNRTTIALANKNARTIWALLTKESPFDHNRYCYMS